MLGPYLDVISFFTCIEMLEAFHLMISSAPLPPAVGLLLAHGFAYTVTRIHYLFMSETLTNQAILCH